MVGGDGIWGLRGWDGALGLACFDEWREKTEPAGKDLPALRAAVCLAEEVGAGLGKCPLLQRRLSQR